MDWPTLLGIVAPWIVVMFGAWGVRQFVLQRRRIAERVIEVTDEIEEIGLDDEEASGREIGTEAPPFTLPDLEGNQVSLDQFHGRRVLLSFVGPSCKFSRDLAAGLAALPPLDGRDGRPELLLVSNKTPEENGEFIKEFGLGCTVLVQKEWEVALLYAAPGSPMGYLLDEHGTVASKLTMGAEELLALASGAVAASQTAPGTAAQDSTGKGGGKR